MNNKDLRNFLIESNKIEGIDQPPTSNQMACARDFLTLDSISIDALQKIVAAFQPYALLRDKPGMNVRVGDHVPIAGGQDIRPNLENILWQANNAHASPFEIHQFYEELHPFLDGNGRSGRMLWLWQMGDGYSPPLGFLHTWYYQSLAAGTTP